MPPDPYVNRTGTNPIDPQVGEFDRTQTPAGIGFVLLLPERFTRKGYEIEGAIANTGTITIRYGAAGTQYEIVGGGAHMRNPITGGVFPGDIFAKTSVGGEKIIAREW